jgi:hypothetical protein
MVKPASTTDAVLLELVSTVGGANAGSPLDSCTDAVLAGLVSAVGTANTGPMVELSSTIDEMLLGLVSSVVGPNTGSGFGAIKSLGEISGISRPGILPTRLFERI